MVSNHYGEPRGLSNAASWAKTRPLSDIRELTEPSLVETGSTNSRFRKYTSQRIPHRSRKEAIRGIRSADQALTLVMEKTRSQIGGAVSKAMPQDPSTKRSLPGRHPPPSPSDNNSISSLYSIPPGNVPPRSSSKACAPNVLQARAARPKPDITTDTVITPN